MVYVKFAKRAHVQCFYNKKKVLFILKSRLEVRDMFMALVVGMVSCLYTSPQTHQVTYVKYVEIYTL